MTRYTRKKLKGGFNPFKLFNLTHHVENIIDGILKRGMRKFIKKLPGKAGELNEDQQEIVMDKVLRIPAIEFKVTVIVKKIVSQIRLGALMGINALIGLIPVPVIPGLVRDANNVIFQILKAKGRIDELFRIKKEAEEALADFSDPDVMLDKMSKVNSIKEMKGHIKDSQKELSNKFDKLSKVGGKKSKKRVGGVTRPVFLKPLVTMHEEDGDIASENIKLALPGLPQDNENEEHGLGAARRQKWMEEKDWQAYLKNIQETEKENYLPQLPKHKKYGVLTDHEIRELTYALRNKKNNDTWSEVKSKRKTKRNK